MALNAALVDKARTVRKEAASVRVGGRTQLEPTTSQWFKARLFLPSAGASPDNLDQEGGRRRQIKQPMLLVSKKDFDRELVAILPEEKIDVDSRELGRATWQVVGSPEPLRRRRSILGWYLQLRKTTEPTRDTL